MNRCCMWFKTFLLKDYKKILAKWGGGRVKYHHKKLEASEREKCTINNYSSTIDINEDYHMSSETCPTKKAEFCLRWAFFLWLG